MKAQDFTFMNVAYKVVSGYAYTPTTANQQCSELFNGSLAPVTSQYLLDGISKELNELQNSSYDVKLDRQAFWICGKVKYEEMNPWGLVDVGSLPSFQTGEKTYRVATLTTNAHYVKYQDVLVYYDNRMLLGSTCYSFRSSVCRHDEQSSDARE